MKPILDYNYTGEAIDCDKLTERELLAELCYRITDYDKLCDERLDLLDKPKYDWSDDDYDHFDSICMEIDDAWCRLREVKRVVFGPTWNEEAC